MSKAPVAPPAPVIERTELEWRGVPGDKVKKLRLHENLNVNSLGVRELRTVIPTKPLPGSMSNIKAVESITICAAGYRVRMSPDRRSGVDLADFDVDFVIPSAAVQYAVPLIETE